jgi:hypothetical protein
VTTKKPTRRPRHAYSPELTDLICERLLDGTSLRQICQDKNMPARSSLSVWLEQHPQFARKYMIAKQIQIDCLLGEKLDIADDRSNDWIEREGPDGKKFRVFDHENFRRSKVQPASEPARELMDDVTAVKWLPLQQVPSDCR